MSLVPPSHAAEQQTASLSLQTALAETRDRILATMLELSNPNIGPPGEARQFLAGFLHLVESAAGGDMGPRDEYLNTVIPAVRASGFRFDATLEALLRASVALVAALAPEHRVWAADFCGDYSRRLLHIWYAGSSA